METPYDKLVAAHKEFVEHFRNTVAEYITHYHECVKTNFQPLYGIAARTDDGEWEDEVPPISFYTFDEYSYQTREILATCVEFTDDLNVIITEYWDEEEETIGGCRVPVSLTIFEHVEPLKELEDLLREAIDEED